MFDLFSFYRLLQTEWLGRTVRYFRTIDSTNRYIREIPDSRISHGMICLADHQSQGKGRFGREWHSEEEKNLMLTIVLKPASNTGIQLFSLAVMLALKETVTNTLSCECAIKWPNDLIISGKKVAGLLTESRYNGKILDRMMLGLGVNVNQTRFPDYLADKSTSLFLQTGGSLIDRSLLLAVLLNRLEPFFRQVQQGDMELIRNINRGIQGYGQWITITVDGKPQDTPVKVLGVNKHGYLMILTANDDVKTFTHEQVRINVDDT